MTEGGNVNWSRNRISNVRRESDGSDLRGPIAAGQSGGYMAIHNSLFTCQAVPPPSFRWVKQPVENTLAKSAVSS